MSRREFRWMVGLLWIGLNCLCLSGFAEEPSSKTNERLAGWLKRFPKADANGDGILTMSEAQAYRKAMGRQRGQRGREPALTPTLKDVVYGSHPRNKLDVYRAEGEGPRPVLIYFHGGGFVSGDKKKGGNVPVSRDALKAGITVVSANYRFVKSRPGEPGEPFPGPMLDGARVVQFVRAHAQEWNIDPGRVVLSGGSAGACMSIWLAVHDDLAKPDSEDPVERQSTRVSGVISYGGQTTLDPKVIVKRIGGNPSVHSSLQPFYGVESIQDLERPEKAKLVQDASSTNFVTKDDPPLLLMYGGPIDNVPLPPNAPTGVSIHHPMFGKIMQEKYEELGLTCYLKYRGKTDAPSEMDFLKQIFGL